jgi:pimeloyl-ACP methyl ester carboxylesterase
MMAIMDAELKRWLDSGEFFDYLGFDIFYRVGGSGPLLLIHGYPFNSFDWAPIWPTLTQTIHRHRTRHDGHGILGETRGLPILGD